MTSSNTYDAIIIVGMRRQVVKLLFYEPDWKRA